MGWGGLRGLPCACAFMILTGGRCLHKVYWFELPYVLVVFLVLNLQLFALLYYKDTVFKHLEGAIVRPIEVQITNGWDRTSARLYQAGL